MSPDPRGRKPQKQIQTNVLHTRLSRVIVLWTWIKAQIRIADDTWMKVLQSYGDSRRANTVTLAVKLFPNQFLLSVT
jgi:hypothetical protein